MEQALIIAIFRFLAARFRDAICCGVGRLAAEVLVTWR